LCSKQPPVASGRVPLTAYAPIPCAEHSRRESGLDPRLLPRSSIARDTGASLAVLPSPGSDGRARLRPRCLHLAHLARAWGWTTRFSFPGRVSIPPASPAELPSQTAAECSSVAFARQDQPMLL